MAMEFNYAKAKDDLTAALDEKKENTLDVTTDNNI